MPRMPQSLARLIIKVSARLPLLIRFGRNTDREMRSDFQSNLSTVLVFLLEHLDLTTGNCVRRIAPAEYCTVTIASVAEDTGVSVRTVNRCFSLLSKLGILDVKKQEIRTVGSFMMCTSAVRKITDKLFSIYGLLPELRADRKYKEEHNLFIKIRRCVIRFYNGKRCPSKRTDALLVYVSDG